MLLYPYGINFTDNLLFTLKITSYSNIWRWYTLSSDNDGTTQLNKRGVVYYYIGVG